MKEEGLLAALAAVCEGKAKDQKVEVVAEILLNAHNELKDKAQMRKELEMARDEAQGMKPSVARKLNEKIRALEAELDTLRTNKKVMDLEKKVKFLEQELKQSYTTKNFTLKGGLLELEKQYRAHMNVDPAMAAFWADVTVLLDEKKDKDSQPQFKGPPSLSASSTPCVSTSSQQQDRTAAAQQQVPAACVSSSQDSAADATTCAISADGLAAVGAVVGAEPHQLQSHPASFGVQMQVEAFNSIISEEAAGAAALPSSSDGSITASQQGDQLPRQAGSFRIMRAQQHPTTAAADGSVVQDPLQPVRVLKESYSIACKDVQFRPLPVTLSGLTADAAPGISQRPSVAEAAALEACLANIRSSVGQLQQLSSQLPTDSSFAQQRLRQLESSIQQLTASADMQQVQQQMGHLLDSLQHIAAAREQNGKSGNGAADEAIVKQFHLLQQDLHRLQQLQQQLAPEEQSQQLLVQVFGDFISQLEQQGVIYGGDAAAIADGAQAHKQQYDVLLRLWQQFLQVNPHLHQPLASNLLSPVTAAIGSRITTAVEHNSSGGSSAVGVQQSPETRHISIQAAVPVNATDVETQSQPVLSPSVHADTQTGHIDLSHAETQHDISHLPALHVGTQAAANYITASTQADGVDVLHIATQSDPLPSPATHVGTQLASTLVTVATQANPPVSSVHAQVQAEVKPQLAEAASQVDIRAAADVGSAAAVPAAVDMGSAAAAPAAADTSLHEASVVANDATTTSGFMPPLAAEGPVLAEEQQQAGSGVIYSASGSELPVNKVVVGQQLDVLHQLEQQRSNENADATNSSAVGDSGSSHHVSAVVQVVPEALQDVQAVAEELSQLRADNLELAASLQVTKSLVDHLNSSMKAAIDKADDAEAEAAQIRVQLDSATSTLQQLQSEHADLTKLLIEAKVEIAEKKGELLELVRNMRRAVEKPTSAAGMVKELQEILAVLPGAEGGLGEQEARSSMDLTQTRPATVSGGVGGLAGLAAGLGQAFGGGSISRRSRAPSDGASAEDAAGSAGGRRSSEH